MKLLPVSVACSAALCLASCASKPAARSEVPAAAPAAAEAPAAPTQPAEAAPPPVADSSAADAADAGSAAEEKAAVTDLVEPPPPTPIFVFAPDEPVPAAPPAAPPQPAPAVAAAPAAKDAGSRKEAVAAPAVPAPPSPTKAPPKAPPPKPKPQAVKPADDAIPPKPIQGPAPKVAALPEIPARAAPAVTEDPVSYSRTVRATVGQLVEVPFRGAGWVYLGETGSRKGLPYDSRRLDADGQSFVFRAEAVGSYSLKFFRQDFIADYVVNDHVRVVVGEAVGGSAMGDFAVPLDRGRVVAEPRWPQAPAKAPAASSGEAAVGTTAAVSGVAAPAAAPGGGSSVGPAAAAPAVGTPPGPALAPAAPVAVAPAVPVGAAAPSGAAGAAPLPAGGAAAGAGQPAAEAPRASAKAALEALAADAGSEAYLSVIKAEADAGRTASALEALDYFRERFPAGSDEAWWLYGRLLEANGPAKDVKAALGFYKRLVAEYPQSSRYDEARKRIAYLERYYFDIR